jgi:hypothetical protein
LSLLFVCPYLFLLRANNFGSILSTGSVNDSSGLSVNVSLSNTVSTNSSSSLLSPSRLSFDSIPLTAVRRTLMASAIVTCNRPSRSTHIQAERALPRDTFDGFIRFRAMSGSMHRASNTACTNSLAFNSLDRRRPLSRCLATCSFNDDTHPVPAPDSSAPPRPPLASAPDGQACAAPLR